MLGKFLGNLGKSGGLGGLINPLTSRRTLVAPFTKISILF